MSANGWTNELLEPMRTVGDPRADAVIDTVHETAELEAVSRILRSLVENDGIVPEDLPGEVRDFLEQTKALPPWADPAQIRRGEEVYAHYGPEIAIILLCASLPACYADAKGVHVLYLTHQLTQFVARRIIETSQMMVNVMAPGGLTPDGEGVLTARKVRLLHATVRHLLSRRPDWNPAWGMPINQEDLALTLMTFSTVVLDSLKKLDITLSRDEEEAYFHAWRVVGDIMGVLPELNPSQVADGRALIEAIATRQYASNEAGQAVTKALVDFLEASIPVRLLKGLPSTMIRHLVGDHVSDLLAVQRPTLVSHMLMEVAIEFFKIADRLENESEIVRRISRPFALHLLQHLETLERGGNRMMFHIPATLREQWGLN